MPSLRARPPGFTLLEVLVVLMITGMVSAILFQGLGGILAVRGSVASSVLDLRTSVLQRNIILDPIRGIIPDHQRGDHMFHGDERAIRGLTIRPLDEAAGGPRPFALAFDYDSGNDITQLFYSGEGDEKPRLVASWRGQQGRFMYGDSQGRWQSSWPPLTDAKAVQIPWLVSIETGVTESEILIAYIGSPHERVLRLQDMGFSKMLSPLWKCRT